MNKFSRYIPWGVLSLTAAVFFYALMSVNWSVPNLFLTPDQQGRLLMQKKEFKRAADLFLDPLQRGVALYRNGDFKEAAAAFGRDDSAEAHYNRANAFLLMGKYDAAISGYEEALALKVNWLAAQENLALARIRKKRLQAPEDDAGGTGGKLEADEIVFDERAKKVAADQQEQIAGGEGLSDLEMRALWLRRIENRPADFLQVKFMYQKQFSQNSGAHGPEKKRD